MKAETPRPTPGMRPPDTSVPQKPPPVVTRGTPNLFERGFVAPPGSTPDAKAAWTITAQPSEALATGFDTTDLGHGQFPAGSTPAEKFAG